MKKITSFLALVLFTSTFAFCSGKKATTDSLKNHKIKNQEPKLISETKVYQQNQNHELVEISTSKYLIAHGSSAIVFPVKEGQKHSVTQEEGKFSEYKVIVKEKVLCSIPNRLQSLSNENLNNMVIQKKPFFCIDETNPNRRVNLFSSSGYARYYYFHEGEKNFNFELKKDSNSSARLQLMMFSILYIVFFIFLFVYYLRMKIRLRFIDDGYLIFLMISNLFVVFLFLGSYYNFNYYLEELSNWKTWLNLLNIGLILILFFVYSRATANAKSYKSS
jgi:hypothetical protein